MKDNLHGRMVRSKKSGRLYVIEDIESNWWVTLLQTHGRSYRHNRATLMDDYDLLSRREVNDMLLNKTTTQPA